MKTVGYVLAQLPSLSETFIGTEMRALEYAGNPTIPLILSRVDTQTQAADIALVTKARYLDEVRPAAAMRTGLTSPTRWQRALQFACAQKGLPFGSLLWNAVKLAKLAEQHGCKHLHAHFATATAAHAIIAARLLGISVSFVGHGHDIYVDPHDLKAKLRSVDAAIAVCADMANDFLSLAPKANVHTLHCGVEIERFGKDTNAIPIAAQPTLLFIGRLIEKKGLDWLIQSIATLPEASRPFIDVVGDGPLQATWQDLSKHYNVSYLINFLGSKTSEWIISQGSRYWGLVAPFVTANNGDRDTGPVVVKEAMAMGLPVIASAHMGLKEIVDPTCGYLVPCRNVQTLADAIHALLKLDHTQRAAMGQAGRDRICHLFNAVDAGKKLSQIIEGL